jgi:hypothetical protein
LLPDINPITRHRQVRHGRPPLRFTSPASQAEEHAHQTMKPCTETLHPNRDIKQDGSVGTLPTLPP